jgi:4-methyl-5(b-hydroxyethyl)-thiazole monophosphate biosynthesis
MIADGSEEMEAVIIADILRRAQIDLSVISISSQRVTCSRKVSVLADAVMKDTDLSVFDIIILPGGMGGTKAFIAESRLLDAIRAHYAAGKLLCAICAAPLALQAAGILSGRKATCHPSVCRELSQAVYTGARVQKDGNLITSQGPGTAFEFALEIITILKGKASADAVAGGLVL